MMVSDYGDLHVSSVAVVGHCADCGDSYVSSVAVVYDWLFMYDQCDCGR